MFLVQSPSNLSLLIFCVLFLSFLFTLLQQEVLCCGNLPNWNPPIFSGSTHPVGLIDEQSGAVTPDFLELQESLPVIRRSTWDQESVERKRRERGERGEREEGVGSGKGVGAGGGREEVLVEGDEDVVYEERRRTNVDDDLEEVRKRLQVQYCC